jgi:hypothetical protein
VSTVDKREIIALLDALSERPLAGDAGASARLTAFCREAVAALAQDERAADRGIETVADTDAVTATLAALISDTADVQARELFAAAAAHSAALRLDAESARAYLAAVDASPRQAPAHLVAEFTAGAGGAAPRAGASGAGPLARIAGGDWLASNWRTATACAVLVVGVGITASLLWPAPQRDGAPAPVAKTASPPPALADAPAAPQPAVAAAPPSPCQPGPATPAAASTSTAAPTDAAPPRPADNTDCGSTPGNQLADRPADPAALARARAEELANARSAAEASKAGAAASARVPALGGAAHSFSDLDARRPAASRMAPAAAPPPAPMR